MSQEEKGFSKMLKKSKNIIEISILLIESRY